MFGWNTSFWIVHSGNGMLHPTCSHALLLSFVWTKEFSFVRRLKPRSFYTIAWKVWIEGFSLIPLENNRAHSREHCVERWFCIHPHTLQKLSVHILSQNQTPSQSLKQGFSSCWSGIRGGHNTCPHFLFTPIETDDNWTAFCNLLSRMKNWVNLLACTEVTLCIQSNWSHRAQEENWTLKRSLTLDSMTILYECHFTSKVKPW